MPIKTLEEKKKQQKLLIVAGILFLVSFVVLYFGVLKKSGGNVANDINVPQPGQEIINKNQQVSVVSEEKLKKIDLNFDFLNNTILPFLKVHGDLPVKKGETGRANPFIISP